MHRNQRLSNSIGRAARLVHPAGAGFLFACLALAPAQTQQVQRAERERQRPTYRLEADLVVIDVNVRYRKCRPVDDLKKENFTVFEDSVPQ